MINKERLFSRLQELGNIGRQESGGVTRLVFTKEDKEAKELVSSYMREAGLAVRMDPVGNVIGRKEGQNPVAPVVLTGSHIDTVYNGGIFDGSLGIIGGIEVLQTMNEQGIETEHPIEVIAYNDEEGARFSFSMLGSRGISGILKPEDLNLVDIEGITFAQAMKEFGLSPQRIGEAARLSGSVKAHVELHPEQGKCLENRNCSVGLVTGINSSLWLKITITGEAGHAGATPMDIRHDALTAAAQIIQVVEKEAQKTGTAVGTVGKLQVYPGGINIIPGTVEFTIDLRDINKEVGDQLEESILSQANEICKSRGVEMKVEVLQRVAPVPCSEEVQKAIKDSFTELGLESFNLPSGAGHDSMHIANICPIGMIFVRSKDGISHNPAEWSTPEDCANGANALYHTLLKLAVPI